MAGTVGLSLTQSDFNERVGGIARDLNEIMGRIEDLKTYLDQYTDAELDTMYGFDSGQGTVLKSAYGDLDQLRSIYKGGAGLANAKDFRAFAKRLYGVGF